jgi:hypothetical protein
VDDSSAAAIVPQAAPGLTAPAGASAGDQREVVAQACAMALADAVAYLRNTEIIATAVVGAATERLLAELDPGPAQAAIEAAQNAVLAAARTLETISQIAASALQDFRD